LTYLYYIESPQSKEESKEEERNQEMLQPSMQKIRTTKSRRFYKGNGKDIQKIDK
jgi:hypothetical protein